MFYRLLFSILNSPFAIHYSLFTYRLTIKFVNSALSINVASQNHVLANTNAKIKLLTIASLIYNRHQYPWCVHNCENKQKSNDGKRKFSSGLWMRWFGTDFLLCFCWTHHENATKRLNHHRWIKCQYYNRSASNSLATISKMNSMLHIRWMPSDWCGKVYD